MICLLCALLLATGLYAQPPDTVWTRLYERELDQEAHACVRTPEGEFVLTGTMGNYPDYDVYVMCIDGAGDTLWTSVYGSDERDTASDLVMTSDRGWLVGGYVYRGGLDGDIFVMKLDSTGWLEWQEEYDAGSWELGGGILSTPDGGYLITGITWGFGAGLGDMLIIKIDSTGNELWRRLYGWPYNDSIADAILVPEGGYLFVGSSNVEWANRDGILLRTDEWGDSLWSRTYGGAGDDDLYTITAHSEGGYLLSGQLSTYANYNSADVWIIRVDETGNTIWERTYGGEYNDYPFAHIQTPDSGFIFVGSTQSFQVGGTKMYVVRTDILGDTLWTRIYGSDVFVKARAVELAPNGDYLIAGYSESGYYGSYDICALRLEQDSGTIISDNHGTLLPHIISISAYPNPFNATTSITFSLPQATVVQLRVYDVLGREVAALYNGMAQAGEHELHADAADWPSGIYFARLDAGETQLTQKLMLLK